MEHDEAKRMSMTQSYLDNAFNQSPADAMPNGQARGAAILMSRTAGSSKVAETVNYCGWQGKGFNAQTGLLRNRRPMLGLTALVGRVDEGPNWLDGKECIVLASSDTSPTDFCQKF